MDKSELGIEKVHLVEEALSKARKVKAAAEAMGKKGAEGELMVKVLTNLSTPSETNGSDAGLMVIEMMDIDDGVMEGKRRMLNDSGVEVVNEVVYRMTALDKLLSGDDGYRLGEVQRSIVHHLDEWNKTAHRIARLGDFNEEGLVGIPESQREMYNKILDIKKVRKILAATTGATAVGGVTG